MKFKKKIVSETQIKGGFCEKPANFERLLMLVCGSELHAETALTDSSAADELMVGRRRATRPTTP